MKYVRCTCCEKKIPLGSDVTIWNGFGGIFCSDECASKFYALGFLRKARLDDVLAEAKGVEVEEEKQ